MAYTDDWESLMNGVFGPGGKLKFSQSTPQAAQPKPENPEKTQDSPLPDWNAALLARQKKLDETVRHWIDELKIVTPSGELPAQALSGGNQQKVVIAKWLENDPKILILNSPTVGVDIGSKADIHACARKLARQGMGVIIISDDISEIMQNCSRVLVMKKGRIVSEHKVSQLTEAELSQQLRED